MYDNLDRLTVVEAAERLGVKEQAVRKRVARGTLHHTKDEDGRVYVYLAPSDTNAKPEAEGNSTDTYTLIRSLEDQVGYLRREVEDWKDESRRKDAILMSLTQRIPELEAAREPRDAPNTGPGYAVEPEGGEPRPATEGAQEAPERRSWWRRLLDG
jgi:excisionase family DNA binding protein